MPTSLLYHPQQADCTFRQGQVMLRRDQRSEHVQSDKSVSSSPWQGYKFFHQGPLMCAQTGHLFESSVTRWFGISQVQRSHQWWRWWQRTLVYILGLTLPSYENSHVTVDEPPHQIRSYTLLFSLFLHFPYVADPPLRTSAPTRPRSRSHDNRTHSIGPISLIWWTYDLRFTCIYFYS